METNTITIAGRHCDGCAHHVEGLLEKEPGVREVIEGTGYMAQGPA